MKDKPSSMRKSAGSKGESVADAGRQRWSLIHWCMAICACLLVLAFVFGSKLTTPLHATFSGELLEPFASWSVGCLSLAFLIGVLSVAIGYVHKPAGYVATRLAGVLAACGISLFCVQVIADGVNVHFDASAATKVTTPIRAIVPPLPGSRESPTLRLVDWRNPHDEISVRQDFRIIHMDVDRKYATFHVRQGFFNMPYAAEYR